MRTVAAASWGLLVLLAAWDLAGAGDALVASVGLCACAFAAALPALVWLDGDGLPARAWRWLARPSPYFAATLLGASHFLLKSQPGSTLVLSALYIVALLAFVEIARWAAYTSKFGEHVGPGVGSAWARAFATRFVQLVVISMGLVVASLALAGGFDGTWSALALAVGLIVTIVVVAKAAARVA